MKLDDSIKRAKETLGEGATPEQLVNWLSSHRAELLSDEALNNVTGGSDEAVNASNACGPVTLWDFLGELIAKGATYTSCPKCGNPALEIPPGSYTMGEMILNVTAGDTIYCISPMCANYIGARLDGSPALALFAI
jgi:hypothetical protein